METFGDFRYSDSFLSEQEEKRKIELENQINTFIKEHGLVNIRPTEYLDCSFYADDLKNKITYKISRINIFSPKIVKRW